MPLRCLASCRQLFGGRWTGAPAAATGGHDEEGFPPLALSSALAPPFLSRWRTANIISSSQISLPPSPLLPTPHRRHGGEDSRAREAQLRGGVVLANWRKGVGALRSGSSPCSAWIRRRPPLFFPCSHSCLCDGGGDQGKEGLMLEAHAKTATHAGSGLTGGCNSSSRGCILPFSSRSGTYSLPVSYPNKIPCKNLSFESPVMHTKNLCRRQGASFLVALWSERAGWDIAHAFFSITWCWPPLLVMTMLQQLLFYDVTRAVLGAALAGWRCGSRSTSMFGGQLCGSWIRPSPNNSYDDAWAAPQRPLPLLVEAVRRESSLARMQVCAGVCFISGDGMRVSDSGVRQRASFVVASARKAFFLLSSHVPPPYMVGWHMFWGHCCTLPPLGL